MNEVIIASFVVGAAVIYGGFLIARVIEKGLRDVTQRVGEISDRPSQANEISRAISDLRHEVAAIRRRYRDESDPPTFDEWVDELKRNISSEKP